jgi:hypothetical protein
MPSSLFIIQTSVYSFTLWFGLYLLARSDGKAGLRFAGLGLVAYALGLACASLTYYAGPTAAWFTAWYPLIALLPAGFWFGAAWSLLPEAYQPTIPARHLLVLIIVFIFVVALVVLGGIARFVLILISVSFALASLWWIRRAFQQGFPEPPLKVLLTATIFFALGCALFILPVKVLSNELVLLAIGGDLALLGYAIGKLDAYDEGTALLPGALRSLAGAGLAGLLVGAQFVLAILTIGQFQFAVALLFYTILSSVIALFTWQGAYQQLLDRALFGEKTRVTSEREALFAVSEALPRLDESVQLLALDEADLTRFTRRALSHYNDLPKLASSPLTRLPVITTRLRADQKPDTSLERAHELRRLLTEHIVRLKPYSDKDFGTGEDWRYYNALYFPYVLGLKPYNVRPTGVTLDPTSREALEWFQAYVPERTLYNWQTAAAKLIAQQLRELGHVLEAE